MTDHDIRWKQRFQNFEKAFLFFKAAAEKEEYSPIEIAGLVHAFEFTFELGWKTIKDYLYAQGIDANSPRAAIKEAFRSQIIDDGHAWIEMLEKRNELSHTYNELIASSAVEIIKTTFLPAIQQIYTYFQKIEND